MATEEVIKNWLLTNLDKMQLNFTNLVWPQKYGIQIYDMSCELRLESRTLIGRGSAYDRDLAILKAFAESLERHLVFSNKILTSSGVAVHQNIKSASNAAALELVERDSFFCHYLSQTPFEIIEEVPLKILKWMENFEMIGVRYSIGRMYGPKELSSVIVCAEGFLCKNPWGIVIATACAEEIPVAIEKAFIELSRAVADKIETGSPKSINLEEFQLLEKKEIFDHYRLGLDIEYGKLFKEKYFSSEKLTRYSIDLSIVDFEELNCEFSKELGIPLVCVRAVAEDIQNAFFGISNFEGASLVRIAHFLGCTTQEVKINTIPHPYR